MASTVGGQLLPQADFDIPLNLATAATASAVPGYPMNEDAYQVAAKAAADFDSQPPKKKAKDGQAGSSGSGSPRSTVKVIEHPVRSDASKPKRVRTGCLTCRERHLKCDEALPRCQNCQKSDRVCKRGVRLNFIDTQV